MRIHIVIIALLFLGLLFLSACTKYKEYCWECRVQSFVLENNSWDKVSDSTTMVCGYDQEEIREYESMRTQINDPVGTSVTTSCQKSK